MARLFRRHRRDGDHVDPLARPNDPMGGFRDGRGPGVDRLAAGASGDGAAFLPADIGDQGAGGGGER
jgi:hypothetical protein